MQRAETTQPQWVVEAVTARKQQRKEAWGKTEKKALEWKEKSDAFFKDGQYREAVACYIKMCDLDVTKPVHHSNLSAAYLKLGEYASALKSSTAALVLDSTHIQSRFRRLQARKALGFYQGALSDAEAIIRQADSDDPDLPEVQKEKRSLQLLIKMRPIDLRYVNDEMDSDPEDDWPNEMERVAPVFDPEICFSDSEDMTHEGNGVPCRYYNRPDGCKNGNACKFSHTPDDMSERDLMGKNVCIFHILGRCRLSDDHCNYSHEKSALPEKGWWVTAAGREEFSRSMKVKAKKAGKKSKKSKRKANRDQKDHFASLLERTMNEGRKPHYDDDNEFSHDAKLSDRERRAAGIFTEDEQYELMCQGVKPWEEDAADVLAVIYGDNDSDDYDYF